MLVAVCLVLGAAIQGFDVFEAVAPGASLPGVVSAFVFISVYVAVRIIDRRVELVRKTAPFTGWTVEGER